MQTRVALVASLTTAVLLGCATGYDKGRPPELRRNNARPKAIERKVTRQAVPSIDPANPERTATELIAWAAASTAAEHERVRGVIDQVSGNESILRALCSAALEERTKDHSRTLIVLAIIGETKSDAGERCLTEFVNLPFPASGHYVQGEILEQTALGTLQAKAVDGLAYLRTATADQTVLRLIREHPSRIVRAEAISAYLWNRGDSGEAKAALAGVVRPDEKIFLDRVRRVPGETAGSFNPKLRVFLDRHPEVQPPAPVKGDGRREVVCPTGCVARPTDQSAPASRGKGE
jgi:hypothetical protein